MPVLIQLPQVGESVTEGVIGKWLVEAGARVKKYDPIVEVTTDKVSMEVPSPFDGQVVRLLVQEGDTVPMGYPIAEIEIENTVAAAPGSGEPASPSLDREAERRARIGEFLESTRSVGPTGSGEGGAGRPDASLEAPVEAPTLLEVHDEEEYAAEGDAPLSPAVRRLVAEYGIDISLVSGTGQGGRVTRDDILAFIDEQGIEAAGLAEGPVEQTAAAGEPVAEVDDAPDGVDEAADEAGEPEGEVPAPSGNVVPLSPVRRTIAHHMERALEIPAAWSMVEVDVTGMAACREANRADFEALHGARLTYLAFAAHAVAQALRDHPRLNARWVGDHVEEMPNINLNIAVSTDKGLVVPVVRDADQMAISELAVAIHRLAEKARTGELDLADVQGGTFTLNNTGALGSVVSVPIINHPQAAIMTTEAVVRRAVVIEQDAIAVRSMMNVCMSFDHRVCDGADAGGLLDDVKTRLQLIAANQRI